MDAIFCFISWGRFGRGNENLILSLFFKFGKQNVHDVLCLKDKTALVCYNVTLVKISVDNENQKTFFLMILNMTKFQIQAIRVQY